MKWFKHKSGSRTNPLIAESVERFGGDGYFLYFGIMEMVAEEFNIHEPGIVKLRMAKIRQDLQLSRQKIVKILSFFNQKAKIILEKNKINRSFFADVQGNEVSINCRFFADLADNHTKKLLSDY